MAKLIYVMIGGSLGALSRYGATLLAVRLFGPQFPWGTLFVNLVGCFFIGLSFALAERESFMTSSVRLFFVTGYLGALTTFSTYAIESVNAFTSEAYLTALANVLSNNLGGAGMVFLGLWLGRIL